jgi:hypothetical protein
MRQRPVKHLESRRAVAAKERKIRHELTRQRTSNQRTNARADITANEPGRDSVGEQQPLQTPPATAEIGAPPVVTSAAPASNPAAQEAPAEPLSQQDGPVSLPNTEAYKIRIDAAQDQIQRQSADTDGLEELLERAISLLETVARHPAMREYADHQQRLDEVEQRLSQGAYPQ